MNQWKTGLLVLITVLLIGYFSLVIADLTEIFPGIVFGVLFIIFLIIVLKYEKRRKK